MSRKKYKLLGIGLVALLWLGLILFSVDAYSPLKVYTYPELPFGASLNAETGKFLWIPQTGQAGEYLIRSVWIDNYVRAKFVTTERRF